MPSLSSAGLWTCDSCGYGGFSSLEEASSHEKKCRKRRREDCEDRKQVQGFTQTRRSFPIMQIGESLPDYADTTACQSLELFEASETDSIEHQEISPRFSPVKLRRVGLRCIHCTPGNAYSTEYPVSLLEIPSSIRTLSYRHLPVCPSVPQHTREAVEQAATRRRSYRRPDSSPDDESDYMALVDHCMSLSRHLGLVEGKTHSGVYFPNDESDVHTGAIGSRETIMVPSIQTTPLARRSQQSSPNPSLASTARKPNQEAQHSSINLAETAGRQQSLYHQPLTHVDSNTNVQRPYEAYYPQPSSYDMAPPSVFPYFQDANGTWVCRYCYNVHPHYRDQGYFWSAHDRSPPPPQFIDQHLAFCRSYNVPQGSQSQSTLSSPTFSYPPYQYSDPPYPTTGSGWDPEYSAQPHMERSSVPASQHAPYGSASNEGSTVHSQVAQLMPQPTSAQTNLKSSSSGKDSQIRHSSTRDPATVHAIGVLVQSNAQHFGSSPSASGNLVLEEDKLLLTDYFFHLMRQLQLVRFTESDRKTRGGKRENIRVGFGGLQCIHCSDSPNSRKFFWSNVDRLANSFAEIPSHVVKCRHCPNPIKNALIELKKTHSQQMSRLSRGSQKVFFRRMWRRLHDEDPGKKRKGGAEAERTVKEEHKQSNSPATSSDESALLIERSTPDAARSLSITRSRPPSPSSRILLSIVEDKEWLSDMDCFVRKNIEVFCATGDDVKTAKDDRKFPIFPGQVGIRCLHCALSKATPGARGTAVSFPYSINGVYESVREFQRLHLESCPNIPQATKAILQGFKGSSSLSSVLRKYYVLAAQALGLFDTKEGIRSGGEAVPLGANAAAVFAQSERTKSSRLPRPIPRPPVQQTMSIYATHPASKPSTPPGGTPIGSSEEKSGIKLAPVSVGDECDSTGSSGELLQSAVTPLASKKKDKASLKDEE